MSLALVLVAGVLFSVGTYLMLQRVLTRIVLGLIVLAHGANLLLLASGGRSGNPPITGADDPDPNAFSDPLPQALALTAIVISFAIVVFVLSLAYRSWVLTHDDEVEDDVEDRRIGTLSSAERAEAEEA